MNNHTGYILRLKIYQPQAHYRIPFTYQRRHTYPLPPYSTVIGFLCNLLGFDGLPAEHEDLKKIKISIAGRFESKTTEYIWFRNLSKEAHLKRFGSITNRSFAGHVEHIGGQSPVLIDVLNNVYLVVHLTHEKESFLKEIHSLIENPVRRLEVLHLGRAEDWVVIDSLSSVFPISHLSIKREDADFKHFFWIPEKIYRPNLYENISDFEEMEGLQYRLPTFWTVEDYDKTSNRHGKRNFEYIKVKLNDGLFTYKKVLFDEECHLPIFLADFGGKP